MKRTANTLNRAVRIEGTIPVTLPIQNNQRFLFISKDQRAFTHGIHKYPAKFFPELPRWIIERYSNRGEIVFDPFMGSGTTNLEASLLGRDSLGVDVDPFSRMIAKVKTTPLPIDSLLRAYRTLKNRVNSYDESSNIKDVPVFPYRDKWFKPYVISELSYIKSSIENLKVNKKIKEFFLICFSSIIRSVSEADNNCTRTVIRKKFNKQVNPMDAVRLFCKRLDSNVEAMCKLVEANPSGQVNIVEGADARDLSPIGRNSVDLALTSPHI